MKCGKCPYSRVDFTDDEDVYYCPFSRGFAFHSGEDCSHNEERIDNDKHKFGHEVIVEATT